MTLARNGVHLFALAGLAFAQPIYNLLEGDPTALIVDGVTGSALLVLALTLLLAPPLLLLAVEALASLAGPRALEIAHLVAVGALVALFVLQARTSVGLLPEATVPLALLAVGIGAAAAVAYARAETVRRFVGVLAFAPPVFAALFLLAGPASPLLKAADPPPAEAGTVPSGAAPVVMIVFDELPLLSLFDEDRRIDAERYPNFARLARDGTWFRNTTSVDAATPWAVPAIMDGNRPRPRRVAAAGYHPHSIFALLGGRHRMNVVEVATRVCPRRLCPRDDPDAVGGAWRAFGTLNAVLWDRLLPSGLSTTAARATAGARRTLGANDPDTVNDKRGAGLREFLREVTSRVPSFRDWTARIGEGDGGPQLSFMHLLLPHAPWEHLPSGRRYKGAEPPTVGLDWVDDQTRVDTYWQAHLLQLQYTDRLLGEVLRRLDDQGMYDRALVAVVADHGASYHAGHPFRYPTPESMPTIAPVPFIVKRPGNRGGGRIDDRPLETIDVLPTIADALGVRMPWPADGRSGFDASTARGDRPQTQGKNAKDPERYPPEALLRDDELLRERIAIGGSGSDDRQLYAARGHAALVDRPVPDDLPADRTGIRARLETPEAWRDVDLDAETIPAYVAGTVTGPGSSGRVIAIAINGRVAAVARTWESRGERFAAIVREQALRPGRNRVELLLPAPGARGLRGATVIGGSQGSFQATG